MKLPQSDKHFTHWTSHDIEYQRNLYDSALPYVKTFGVALDIGAHVGYFSKYMLEHFKNVVAVEPVIENVDCYIQNVDMSRVVLITAAAHYKYELLNLSRGGDNSGDWRVASTGEVICLGVPLDVYGFTDVSFIKIDVQGHEVAALMGLQKTIERWSPPILVEITNDKTREYLESIGYVLAEQAKKDDYVYTRDCSLSHRP